jgi:hypothetical protein
MEERTFAEADMYRSILLQIRQEFFRYCIACKRLVYVNLNDSLCLPENAQSADQSTWLLGLNILILQGSRP